MGHLLVLLLLLAGCPGDAPKDAATADSGSGAEGGDVGAEGGDGGAEGGDGGAEGGDGGADSDTSPVDGDGDGYTAEDGDCDDTDPDQHPNAAEVCADGEDNDCDALIDCEDSPCDDDCAEADCADDADNDADGWVDCMDDDCWGRGVCSVTTSARVKTGWMHARRGISNDVGGSRPSSDNCDQNYDTPWMFWTFATASPHSVVGTVVVQTTSGVQTCDWKVGRGHFTTQTTRTEFADFEDTGSSCDFVGNLTLTATETTAFRSEVWVTPGCPVDGTGFLPADLEHDSRWKWRTAEGGIWYTGDAETTRTTSYRGGSTQWQVDPLAPGVTYTRTW